MLSLLGIVNIILGGIILLVAFKVINPFKKRNNKKLEEEWYQQNGKLMKILGFVIILFGLLNTF
ncbi:hypothetical protein [Aureivirga sp. CE67]|uniref:hypothetical protein n=1 Tax=Aureivirga sp. CE67 TaxID=1788983 RepID=UPI0018C90FD7|nr:hypothetical protein [Aureivirga sp. CE67]